MRITEIRERTVSLSAPMRNASISFGAMTASAVAVTTDVIRNGKPVIGLSFDSPGRYGHGGLLRERFIPRILEADPEDLLTLDGNNLDPHRVWNVLMRNEKAGGHGERCGAVGLLDCAVWDAVAKIEEKPLWRVLSERYCGLSDQIRVPVYASGGHYRDHDDLAHLHDSISRSRDLGFTKFKIKFGGLPLEDDLRRVETAISAVQSSSDLAIDCNGTWSGSQLEEMAARLSPYQLGWIEEPVHPLDYELSRAFASQYKGPIATGENIFSADDTLNLLRYGGLRPDRDILQMDVSLSYGLVEYLRIVELAEQHGWSRSNCIPHAGFLLAFNVVAGLELGRHETSMSGSFALYLPTTDGYVRPDEAPGVGYERSPIFRAIFSEL